MSEPDSPIDRPDAGKGREANFVRQHSRERNDIIEQFPTMNFPGPEPVEYLRLRPQLEMLKYGLMWSRDKAPDLHRELDRLVALMHPYLRLRDWQGDQVGEAVQGFVRKLEGPLTSANQLFAQAMEQTPDARRRIPQVASLGSSVMFLNDLMEAMHAQPPSRSARHLDVADLGPTAGILTTLSPTAHEQVMADPLLACLQRFAPHEWAARANSASSVTHWVERMLAARRKATVTDPAVDQYVGRYLHSTIRLLRDPAADRARTRYQLSVIVKPVQRQQELAVELREQLDGLLRELDDMHLNIKFAAGHDFRSVVRGLADTLCRVHPDCRDLVE